MIATLATLVVFLLIDPSVLVVDVFTPKDSLRTSVREGPHIDDLDTVRLWVRLTEN